MQERLAALKAEFEKGQQQLQALDQQRAQLRDTLLRISGAIQVLEELLAAQQQNGHHVSMQETDTPVEASL